MLSMSPRSNPFAAAILTLVLVGCSPGESPPAGTPQSSISRASIAAGPGGITNAEGPYPVRVLAADTVQLDRGGRGLVTVHLVGVVTPEGGEPAACFAGEATAEAHRLLDGERVRAVTDHAPARLDGHGDPMVYLWLDSGRMVNDLLVEGGFAREATGVPGHLYRYIFAGSEQRARAAGRGLWSPGTCDGNIAIAPRPAHG